MMKATVSFWYDVRADHHAATVDQLPGWKPATATEFELWLYRYLPADAQAAIRAANPAAGGGGEENTGSHEELGRRNPNHSASAPVAATHGWRSGSR